MVELTKRNLIKAILKDRLFFHDNYFSARHWWWRWFYSAKAIICVVIGREGDLYGDPDAIDSVAFLNYRSVFSLDCMDAKEWDEIAISPGVFRGWRYGVYSNGNC